MLITASEIRNEERTFLLICVEIDEEISELLLKAKTNELTEIKFKKPNIIDIEKIEYTEETSMRYKMHGLLNFLSEKNVFLQLFEVNNFEELIKQKKIQIFGELNPEEFNSLARYIEYLAKLYK